MNAPAARLVLLPCPLDELVDAVADRVAERLSERPAAPATLDRRGIAAALGVGVDTIDRLRREGLPELRIGDAPRFELAAALTWLREKSTGVTPPRGSQLAAGGSTAK